MKKADVVCVRLEVPDFVYTKEEYDNNENMEDCTDGATKVGYEDVEGNECEEDGTYLDQNIEL
jgi:hypothetical protein